MFLLSVAVLGIFSERGEKRGKKGERNTHSTPPNNCSCAHTIARAKIYIMELVISLYALLIDRRTKQTVRLTTHVMGQNIMTLTNTFIIVIQDEDEEGGTM